ncbi:MAG: serine hydrolase [bacterium]|nr:serine hydrolase [bacterium]
MNKLKSVFALIVLFTFTFCSAAFSQISSAEVDKLTETVMKKFDVAGMAVGIVKDGKIIHSKGYGVSSVKTKEKVNEHTQFAIASNSKAFTAAGLAILIDEGKLSWHDKVKDYIPEFKMYNAYVTENFTIEDLLTHRSGLGLGAGDLMIFPDGSDFTMKDVITSFQYQKPVSAFRTKFDYDNLLYIVAGEVIARISGKTWEDFIETRIMSPLGMDRSAGTFESLKDKKNVAMPHSEEKGEIKQIKPYSHILTAAAGGIYSNVDDLCNWMLVHLNEGKYGKSLDKQLFSNAAQQDMWKIHTTLGVNRNPRYNSHFSGYGLGWGLTDIKGNMKVSHTGGLPGMLSVTILIPDLEFGIVILTNTSDGGAGAFEAVSRTIVDSYLGLDDYKWTDKIYGYMQNRKNTGDSVTTKVWEAVKSANSKNIIKENYVGYYRDNWFGKIKVYIKNNQLWFKSCRSPKLTGQMFYYKANAFAVKWEYQDMNADAFAVFSLDEEGKAKSIKMKGISPNIDFSFDFQDLDLKRLDEK